MNSNYIDILKAGWTICSFLNDDQLLVHVSASRRNGEEEAQVVHAEVFITNLEDEELSNKFWESFELKCRTFAMPEL